MKSIELNALLAASELVANVVVHTGMLSELSYSNDGAMVEIAVRDGDRKTFEAVNSWDPSTSPSVKRGRGLLIVSGVADEWGVDELADGKRVWARWHLEG